MFRKLCLLSLFFLSINFVAYPQQFNLLWSKGTDANLSYIGDIDNDGKGEFYLENSFSLADTNYITDFTLNNIKYDLRNIDMEIAVPYRWLLDLEYFDFNHDGHIDFYFRTGDSWGVYDLVNNQILFELKEKAFFIDTSIRIEAIDDIDGDGKIDLFLNEHKSGSPPIYDFYYLYSTDVSITSAVNSEIKLPSGFLLNQNYPNPFNPITTIEYELPRREQAKVSVFDILGREVAVLEHQEKDAGNYKVKFDGRNFSSGVYFYRLQAGEYSNTKKFLLLK